MKINLVIFRAVWTAPTEREGKKMREMKNITQKSRCLNAKKHSIFLLSTPSIFEYIEHKYI